METISKAEGLVQRVTVPQLPTCLAPALLCPVEITAPLSFSLLAHQGCRSCPGEAGVLPGHPFFPSSRGPYGSWVPLTYQEVCPKLFACSGEGCQCHEAGAWGLSVGREGAPHLPLPHCSWIPSYWSRPSTPAWPITPTTAQPSPRKARGMAWAHPASATLPVSPRPGETDSRARE